MQSSITQKEETLENLHAAVEQDAKARSDLEKERRRLEAEGIRKEELIEKLLKEAEENQTLLNDAIGEIIQKSEQIYLEYKQALGTFRVEPAPLPQDPEGATDILNWILSEFSALMDIFGMASDNSAVVSCESILAILDSENCSWGLSVPLL